MSFRIIRQVRIPINKLESVEATGKCLPPTLPGALVGANIYMVGEQIIFIMHVDGSGFEEVYDVQTTAQTIIDTALDWQWI